MLSLNAFAKSIGVSCEAVSRAVRKGRLAGSVVRDEAGRPKINDPELARREWEANVDRTKAPASVKVRPRVDVVPAQGVGPEAVRESAEKVIAAAERAGLVAPNATAAVEVKVLPLALSLADEVANEKRWKGRLAELEFRREAGELVEAKEVAEKIAQHVTLARTKLLAIPSRAKLQLPHLTIADIGALELLIREALEELAGLKTEASPRSSATGRE